MGPHLTEALCYLDTWYYYCSCSLQVFELMGKAVTQIACGRYIYTVLDQFTLHFVLNLMDEMYMILHVYVHSRKLASFVFYI